LPISHALPPVPPNPPIWPANPLLPSPPRNSVGYGNSLFPLLPSSSPPVPPDMLRRLLAGPA
jgi:hypothetical protein